MYLPEPVGRENHAGLHFSGPACDIVRDQRVGAEGHMFAVAFQRSDRENAELLFTDQLLKIRRSQMLPAYLHEKCSFQITEK